MPGSTTSSTTSSPAMSRTPSTIAAFPSFTHSLAALPSLTAVSSDMVHGATKQAAHAKLHTALQATRQKMPGTQSPLSPPPSPLHDPLDWPEDEEALVIPRRKAKRASN